MTQIVEIRAEDFDRRRSDLVSLLVDSVAHGASVGFVLPLTNDEAERWVESLRASIVSRQRLLWFAEHDGGVCGSVQLELCTKANGINRAEVQKLLVASTSRRLGIGRMLMQAVETRAAGLERGLVYLDTEAGSSAEPFYQSLGYTRAGGIPEYACGPDGTWRANAIYYKSLFLRSPT
ncbi:GNAT family N-acetyltransferase [Uliginosibacterium sp. H3]|uniref:GNAT family N-acetyltransferase n=1 Tax=Uliginosibacterium silvisoli TaxID=3114758 RepID=A0ABU6K922_9RHOO|nr:GNAT family N-acetyltransferase [Uliginosibacterium sp. H3]